MDASKLKQNQSRPITFKSQSKTLNPKFKDAQSANKMLDQKFKGPPKHPISLET